MGLRQDGNRGHWMKTLKPQHDPKKMAINNEKFDKKLHFYNQS
jgi:hypothetical protein